MAVGGGSPMDVAKAVGVVAVHGGSIADYEWGHDPIERRIPPLVTVPTTAGTGSEVTLWAVDHRPRAPDQVQRRRHRRSSRRTSRVIDPELMLGMPPAITAATGMDALAHAVECYTCDYHQFFNDAVALHAVELVAAWLERAVADGSDLEARTGMAHAATLGGMAYGTESAGAAHAMSQSAGGVHDCSHGALTARLLGPVCEFNAPASPERYARLARGLGADVAGLDPLEAALAGVARAGPAHRRGRHPDARRARLLRGRDPDAGADRLRGPADDRQSARAGRRGLRGDLPRRVRARRLSGPAALAAAGPSAELGLPDPHALDPGREGVELPRDDLARLLVDQARLVERLARVADHHLGLEQGVRLERLEAGAQAVLHADGPQAARRRAHDRHRLVLERLVRRPRRPVDGVLQHARHGVVVLGRDDEEAVGRGDGGAQAARRLRVVLLQAQVVVVERQGAEVGLGERPCPAGARETAAS